MFAHMQYAANGKRATSCTFGGVVRPMTLDVMYCTDYRDRYAPVRFVTVGFAPVLAESESMGEVAAAGHVFPRQKPKPQKARWCTGKPANTKDNQVTRRNGWLSS